MEKINDNKEEKKERVAIFIDGSNFYHSVKKILKPNERVDYEKLINLLVKNRDLVITYYYVTKLDENLDKKKYDKHQAYIEKLSKIEKFKIILCGFKKIKQMDGNYNYIVKGDDIYLAHDLLIGVFDNLYDTAIIVSGDEDFLPLIQTIRVRFGKRVENAYFRASSSYKLRKSCNFSLRLNKIISKFVTDKVNTSSSAIRR